MRSLVRPSNVSPVLVDYPRYLHHREGKRQSFLSAPVFTVSSCDRAPLTTLRGETFDFSQNNSSEKKKDSKFFFNRSFTQHSDAFIYSKFTDDAVVFSASVSVLGTFADEGSLCQWLPGLRVLRVARDGERRRAEADDRNRQAATFGQAAPERETKHHSDGAPGGAPHCAAQTALGPRQTGRYSWARQQFTHKRSRLWNSELCRYK